MATVKEHYDYYLGNFYSWMVGDLASNWKQKISSYKKARIKHDEIVTTIEQNIMIIQHNQIVNKLITIIACKKIT
jgi:hypothetical protein